MRLSRGRACHETTGLEGFSRVVFSAWVPPRHDDVEPRNDGSLQEPRGLGGEAAEAPARAARNSARPSCSVSPGTPPTRAAKATDRDCWPAPSRTLMASATLRVTAANEQVAETYRRDYGFVSYDPDLPLLRERAAAADRPRPETLREPTG